MRRLGHLRPLLRRRDGVVRLCAALLAAACAAAAASGQDATQAEEGAIVRKIEILGNRRISEEAIKAKLRTREGQPYRAADLTRDIKALTQANGYFLDVAVDHRVLPDGQLILRFRVAEMNFVESVRCEGVQAEKVEEVREEVRLERGRFVHQHDLDLKARQLESWYRRKGYRYAQVRAESRPTQGGGTEVIFRIDEGPQVRVTEIVFRGNPSIPSGELRGVMETGTAGFLGLFGQGLYDPDVVAADCVRLQDYYRDRGFKDAVVTLLDERESVDFAGLSLVIGVEEGEAYQVEAIEIEGNHLFTDAELRARMKQRAGERFEGPTIAEDVRAILRRYQEHAYLDVALEDEGWPQLVYSIEAPRVKLRYRIREGERIRLGQIRLEGNEVTRDKVILRELTVAPGEWADMTEIRRSVARLASLGYFEVPSGVMGPVFEETASPTVKNMVLRFRERPTGQLHVGAGVGSDSGLQGILSLVKENFDLADLPRSFGDLFSSRAFSGGGQTVILSVAPGVRFSNMQVRFIEPHVFDTPWRFDANAFLSRRRYDTYEDDRTGVRVGLGRRLDRDLGLRDVFTTDTFFSWEVIDLEDARNAIDWTIPPVALREERTLRIHAIDEVLRYASWDDPLLTTRGFEASVRLQSAGGCLGGSEDFNKIELLGEAGLPLYTTAAGQVHVFGLRGRVGWAEEFGRSDFVPLVERFFIGGSETLRGFDFQGVGPRDRNGDVTGGQAMWATSLEYRFPLVAPMLRGLVFWDAGALAERLGDDALDQVRHSVGFGFRITIPFLGPRPLALDFGFPLKKERHDDTRLISFTIGRFFF
ncbi:MAG: outer membrane protein assembly factor BamA [Planctomycetes bacterium]|nr:outer membrane protein assembly factor BamA [Planctomycetota bacterium]